MSTELSRLRATGSDDGGSNYFAFKKAVLTTMHGKELAIAPMFRDSLSLDVEVASGIDTDALGTFTGEVPRVGTMRDAAIAKARLGMRATGISIGVASEGSYGPHPHVPIISAGIEMIVLVDDDSRVTVSEQLIDAAPVYRHTVTPDIDGAADLLEQVRFPTHGLIVRPNDADGSGRPIHKGLRSIEALGHAIAISAARAGDGMALVQTDMRAHMNPTRMLAIARVAKKLCGRLATPCPICKTPGFGQVDVEVGLPCEWCGGASLLVRHLIFGCVACEHREARPRTDGLSKADPGKCPVCNP